MYYASPKHLDKFSNNTHTCTLYDYHTRIQIKNGRATREGIEVQRAEEPHTENPGVSNWYESCMESDCTDGRIRERFVAAPLAVLVAFDGAY